MNFRAHWLSAYLAISHLTIGLSELLHVGPRFLPPSWQVIYRILPNGWDWVYPELWVLTGLVGLAGIRWPTALRIAFRMSAVLFLSWAVAGIPALMLGLGGNIQGSAANAFTAGCAWVLAYYVKQGVRGNQINVQVSRLAEQVYDANGHDEVAG